MYGDWNRRENIAVTERGAVDVGSIGIGESNWRAGGGSFRRMTSPAPCQNTGVEGSLGHPVGALSVLRVTDTSRPDQFTFNPGLF